MASGHILHITAGVVLQECESDHVLLCSRCSSDFHFSLSQSQNPHNLHTTPSGPIPSDLCDLSGFGTYYFPLFSHISLLVILFFFIDLFIY